MTIKPAAGQRVEVCIIGAGPAGLALAIRLAQFGLDVCVVERSIFPRSHVGESLSPGIWPQLDLLGVSRIIAAAGFWPCRTALVQWEGDVPVRRDFGVEGGLLVDRGRFDALLLDCARAHGVRVIQPAVLRAHTPCHNGWRLNVESAEGIRTLDANFLADASGRSGALRGRKQRADHRTLALYSYWRGANFPSEPRIEAASETWYWGVPLPDGTFNAMVFLDADNFRARRLPSLRATYQTLIGRSDLMAACLDRRLAGPVRVADATPYLDRDSIGPRIIKVGDSALALDPLSSSGVQKAINTALTGAVVVNTMLRCPERADAAMRFYAANLTQASDQHRRWASGHYAIAATTRPGGFWRTRAAGAEPEQIAPHADFDFAWARDIVVTLSPEATLAPEPCIVGDLVAMKYALHHPGLATPVAFLGGWEVATLLRPLQRVVTIGGLMDAWQIPVKSKTAIAGWLLKNRVLTLHHTIREGGAP
jgi:flavin-dependent dehydrogenase